jgi:hypothetical protein
MPVWIKEKLFQGSAARRAHRLLNGLQAPGREGQVGLKQAFELEERLDVEGNVVDVFAVQASFGQAVGKGAGGNPALCLQRVKRSSCAAATILPSTRRAAALS